MLAAIVGFFMGLLRLFTGADKPKPDVVQARQLGQDEQKLAQEAEDNAALTTIASAPVVSLDPVGLRAPDRDSRD
jgi:hypothetical protein